jgi:hypothetical protein
MSPSTHLRTKTVSVSEVLCFLVVRITDDGQSPEIVFLSAIHHLLNPSNSTKEQAANTEASCVLESRFNLETGERISLRNIRQLLPEYTIDSISLLGS